ncbi:hypothetical protein LV779_37495 [Streptomyces thinghirensis]|nr:hypothetical protein [Streptomyces thinghirensis]
MVNCTILASIFAGPPKVDVHLIAYDTALDLTPRAHDLLRDAAAHQARGGTDGTVAMILAQPKISEPRNTVVVWISDFYEWRHQELFDSMAAIHRSGAKFIPVGSVTSSDAAASTRGSGSGSRPRHTGDLRSHQRSSCTNSRRFT